MGFEQEDFTRGLIAALSNDSVLKKLEGSICKALKFDLKQVITTNKNVQSQLEKFKESNSQLTKEVAELRDIVVKKDKQILSLSERIMDLEKCVDEQEQYSRRNSLRISGFEESMGEDIMKKTLDLFNKEMKIMPPVVENEVERIHRVGPWFEGKSRAVLVKFTSWKTKNKVYSKKKMLKKKKTDENGINYGIFMNEDLTKFRSSLLYKARRLTRERKLNGCWTIDGKVMIKNFYNRVVQVRNDEDLNRTQEVKNDG